MNNDKILPSIYVDLDCTIYNLNSVVCSHYNIDFNDNKLPEDNTTYWFGGFNKAPRQYFIQLLNQKGIFYEGKPIGNCIEIINKLHDEGYPIYFLTLPLFNTSCVLEKVEWLKKYFKWFNPEKDLIMTGNKKLLDDYNRILYDDNMDYLNWKRGISICYSQPWNKDYRGSFIVDNHDKFYKMVHLITDDINEQQTIKDKNINTMLDWNFWNRQN